MGGFPPHRSSAHSRGRKKPLASGRSHHRSPSMLGTPVLISDLSTRAGNSMEAADIHTRCPHARKPHAHRTNKREHGNFPVRPAPFSCVEIGLPAVVVFFLLRNAMSCSWEARTNPGCKQILSGGCTNAACFSASWTNKNLVPDPGLLAVFRGRSLLFRCILQAQIVFVGRCTSILEMRSNKN